MVASTNSQWATQSSSRFLVFLLVVASNISVEGASKFSFRRWESTGIVNSTFSKPEFICDNKQVISLSARCDGTNDCKDYSDERKCTECKTPFSLNGTDGFLECISAKRIREDIISKERLIRYIEHYPSLDSIACEETRLEAAFWKEWKSCCPEGEFRCTKEAVCLPSSAVCDGVGDCGAVEKYAWSDSWRTNRYIDTHPDEENCKECNSGSKMCAPTGKCIPVRSLCNGVNDCSDGSDEKNCTTCSGANSALCSNGQCISSEQVCDGAIDCEDASDEQNCPSSCASAIVTNTTRLPKIVTHHDKRYLKSEVCSGFAPASWGCSNECDCKAAFTCDDGTCIRKAQVCDGKRDCFYGEDEKACLAACAKYPFFTCINNGKVKCLPMSSKCDGVWDCTDGKDEKTCSSCPDYAHRCDGGCIPESSRCDGVRDCNDGSDEKNCSCEDCTDTHLDTYSCESSGVCMKRAAACRNGKSRCKNPTMKDELFCDSQYKKMKGSNCDDASRL